METCQPALTHWLKSALQRLDVVLSENCTLTPMSGDAGFRRYYRLQDRQRSWIVVDAPPATENSRAFIAIARAWAELGIRVPEVFEADVEQGFMLLSDLGSVHYLERLNGDSAGELYATAFRTLIRIQGCQAVPGHTLPDYDRAFLLREMALFQQWFVEGLLRQKLSAAELQTLQRGFAALADSALEQPRVCVHRDYHSRNLLVTAQGVTGVIDFQDAVWGPVSYDLVSLLKDCYIQWPAHQLEPWIRQYLALAEAEGILPATDYRDFLPWFELMGMQRHIKAVGIFARLRERDGKDAYLASIPRTLGYILDVCRRYPQFAEFDRVIGERLVPAMVDCGYFSADSLSTLR